jgi:hypothetical protein
MKQNMNSVITIPARGDNFMYLYPCGQAMADAAYLRLGSQAK